jgi:hypothetical protein
VGCVDSCHPLYAMPYEAYTSAMPLSERDQQRARTSLPIARMARTQEFRNSHPRELTFIVVLPDDTGVRLVSLTPEPVMALPASKTKDED